MPRPRKCRQVCGLPKAGTFTPNISTDQSSAITMTVDEYETIRLIDKEGLSQEQCGEAMNIARTTVQLIYSNARFKLATALVDAVPLVIEGGDYVLCESPDHHCPRHQHCHRQQSSCCHHEEQKGSIL